MHVFVPLLLGYNSSHLPTPSLKVLIALRKKKKGKKNTQIQPPTNILPKGDKRNTKRPKRGYVTEDKIVHKKNAEERKKRENYQIKNSPFRRKIENKK